jgi:hypothetical protein
LINSNKGKIIMNKSKITALTAMATVMSATAAHANTLTLTGLYQGIFNSGDAHTGIDHAMSTSSVYVQYSSTLDNGMGLSAGFSVTQSSMGFATAIDTGMGTLSMGQIHNSAVDGMDGMKAGATTVTGANGIGTYSDGDTDEGMGVKFTSNPIAGWTVALSVGENTANIPDVAGVRNTALAVSGSLGPVALSFGAVDDDDGTDDNFVTLGYSVAGVNLGYGLYDDDAGAETSVIGLNTTMAGLNLAYTYDDLDAATDQDQSRFSIGKDLGGMSVTLQYTDLDNGTGTDVQNWGIIYSVGIGG